MKYPCCSSVKMPVLFVVLVALSLNVPVIAQETATPCIDGEALYRQAKFTEARVALRECLDASGPNVDVLLPLVVMGVRENRLEEAIEYGATAVELAPANAEAHYWYGRALLRGKRTADAKAEWEKGLRQNVEHLGVIEGLARLALAERETAKAYQLFTRMKHLGVQESWLERLLGDIAASKGLWSESLVHLREAMLLSGGGTAKDLMTAAELSIMAGDKAGAVVLSRQAMVLAPGAETYGNLGQAFFAYEQVDSALVYLQLAVEQAPTNAVFRFNLANALEISGQVEAADYHFRTFLTQQPNDSVGHFNYAIHLEKMGRSAEATVAVRRAIELDAKMLTARVVLVQILEGQGLWTEGLNELAELQILDEANGEYLTAWRERLVAQRDQTQDLSKDGKVHFQHMVLASAAVLAQVQAEMESGADFTSLVVRFSTGPAAARGGDIGWVKPVDMVLEMREILTALAINEISPPIESKGLYHIFKRIP